MTIYFHMPGDDNRMQILKLCIYINKVTVCLRACHTFQYNLTNFESSDILSVSNTYTNGATLSVSQLEQSGTLAPLKF